MNTKHKITFSGFQSSQPREKKKKQHKNQKTQTPTTTQTQIFQLSFGSAYFGMKRWTISVEHHCNVSSTETNRFHPLLINAISRHILPTLLTLLSLLHNTCFRFWQVRSLWISQDDYWQLCSELLHFPYMNRFRYIPSPWYLIKDFEPLGQSHTYSI